MIIATNSIQIEVGKIQLHPVLQSFATKITYGITNDALTNATMEISLITQPIILIKEKTKNYCICGIRTFLLAKTELSPEEKITVTTVSIENSSDEGVLDLAMSDAYLKHFLHSLARPEVKQLQHLYKSIGESRIQKLAPCQAMKSAFAKLVGKSRQRIFYNTEDNKG